MGEGVRSPGAFGVAAPVHHPEGLYVLTVFGPRDRILTTGPEVLAVDVLQATKSLSSALSSLHASL